MSKRPGLRTSAGAPAADRYSGGQCRPVLSQHNEMIENVSHQAREFHPGRHARATRRGTRGGVVSGGVFEYTCAQGPQQDATTPMVARFPTVTDELEAADEALRARPHAGSRHRPKQNNPVGSNWHLTL